MDKANRKVQQLTLSLQTRPVTLLGRRRCLLTQHTNVSKRLDNQIAALIYSYYNNYIDLTSISSAHVEGCTTKAWERINNLPSHCCLVQLHCWANSKAIIAHRAAAKGIAFTLLYSQRQQLTTATHLVKQCCCLSGRFKTTLDDAKSTDRSDEAADRTISIIFEEYHNRRFTMQTRCKQKKDDSYRGTQPPKKDTQTRSDGRRQDNGTDRHPYMAESTHWKALSSSTISLEGTPMGCTSLHNEYSRCLPL